MVRAVLMLFVAFNIDQTRVVVFLGEADIGAEVLEATRVDFIKRFFDRLLLGQRLNAVERNANGGVQMHRVFSHCGPPEAPRARVPDTGRERCAASPDGSPVSYTHLRAHETGR